LAAAQDIDYDMLNLLKCPVDGADLRLAGGELVSTDGGHRYPIVDGIPYLLPQISPTHSGYLELLGHNARQLSEKKQITKPDIQKYLKGMLGSV
jgi:uncharacterized protein YbaR (Trm112 family)